MNGLVGGFLPAWYAMKKDKGRRAICRVVIEAPIQLGTAPGSGGS